jgi:DNA-binding transcriptional LysR family regulator
MDLRDLRYFETIADLEHLGRAAAKLHRSPPALTKAIQRLEDSLGTALFDRRGRGIRLTAAGHALRRRAKVLDVAMDDTVREIDAVTRGASGHLRIGVAPTIAQYLLPEACRLFLASSQEVTIETLIGMSNFLRQALHDGVIDFAVSVGDPTDDFVAHPIIEDNVVVVAGSDHEIFRKRPAIADLARYRWSFISRRNLGRGHVAAPLREVRIRDFTLRRHFTLLYRKDSYLSPVSTRFMDLLRDKAQALFMKG